MKMYKRGKRRMQRFKIKDGVKSDGYKGPELTEDRKSWRYQRCQISLQMMDLLSNSIILLLHIIACRYKLFDVYKFQIIPTGYHYGD